MIDCSIIILNYNMKGLLKQCVQGIERFGPDCSLEVIVVDNASVDGSTSLLARWVLEQPFRRFRFRLLQRETNDGYAVGNNEGIRASSGRHVLILNPDIAIMPGSIQSLLQYAATHQAVAAVGPRLLNPDKSMQFSCYRFPKFLTPAYRRTWLANTQRGIEHVERYMMMDWDHRSARPVDWIMGSAMLLRRDAIEAVGGLDERFFMYYEDIDWCRRLWMAGYEVHYEPRSTMVHYHQRLSAETGFKALSSWATRTHIISALRYYHKYRGARDPGVSTRAQLPIVSQV